MSVISVQLYSIREAISIDAADALRRVAELGFTQVEPYGLGHPSTVAVGEALAAAGLVAPSAHGGLVTAPDTVGDTLAAAAALGVQTLVDPHIPAERWTEREDVVASAATLNEIARRAAGEHGLAIGYHNHWWEAGDLGGVTALEVFADALDDDLVLEVDTYWAQVGGADPVALLGRLGERVTHIHVKDGDASQDPRAQLPAGQGVIDIPAVLAAAPQAVRVLEFDDYAGDMFEGLAASLAYVRGLA